MKKYTILSIGLLFLMLAVGGMAYGQEGMGSSGSSDQSGTGSTGSSDQSGMGGTGTSGSSDQSGMGGTGTSGSSSSESQGGVSSGMGTSGQAAGQVDINTASIKELEKVPGMSKSMAKNIVKYRDQNGPFSSVDDLSKVKGVSQNKLDAMRSQLTVGQAGTSGAAGSSQQQGTGTSGMGTGSGGMSGGAGSESGGSGGMGTSGSSSGAGSSGSGSASSGSGY